MIAIKSLSFDGSAQADASGSLWCVQAQDFRLLEIGGVLITLHTHAIRAWEESIYLYNPSHLRLIDEVRANWLFPPFTGERCEWVFVFHIQYIYTCVF